MVFFLHQRLHFCVVHLAASPLHYLTSQNSSSIFSSHVLTFFCVTAFLTCCSYLDLSLLIGILLQISRLEPALGLPFHSTLKHVIYHILLLANLSPSELTF
jgi:hypothetical protein